MGHKFIFDTILARLDALEAATMGRPRRRLSKAELAKLEGISTRSVDRRVKDRRLPPSDDIIGGRHFWWSDSLERHRRMHANPDSPAARAARNPALRHKPPAQTTSAET
jgi:predicted DNA-binding transcriptional regulator AlpA